MKICVALVCFFVAVSCQTQNSNGNPTGEIGSPAFDEIVVESTLTVRGKSPGTRNSKALVSKEATKKANPEEEKKEAPKKENPEEEEMKKEATNGTSAEPLTRSKRVPRQRYGAVNPYNAYIGLGRQPGERGPFGPIGVPSSSSSAAQSSSNGFNSQTPFGNFGASASQSSSQSQNFGANGFEGSAGHSASQTYRLPNGNQIDVSFSNGYSIGNGRPSFANSQSITVTGPNGEKQQFFG